MNQQEKLDFAIGKAKKFKEAGQYEEMSCFLKDFVSNFDETDIPNEEYGAFLTVVGSLCSQLNDYKNAIMFYQKAVLLFPDSEITSVGLYHAYVSLDYDEFAIGEIIRFLSKRPAEKYVGIIEDLLEDVSEGYALIFREFIEELAKRNGILNSK